MQTQPPFVPMQQSRVSLWAWLATFVLHGGLGFVIWLGHNKAKEEVALLPRDFMVTKIVRLGKKRPPELLPHLTPPNASPPEATKQEPQVAPVEPAPPPPKEVPLGPEPVVQPSPTPAPPEPTKLATDPNAPAAPKDGKATVKKPTEKNDAPPKDFRSAIAKARQLGALQAQAEAEGDPSGDPDGNSDTASAGDIYATAVYRVYHQAWNIPDFAKAQQLAAQARIFVGRDGRILRATLIRPSGNGPFDGSVEEVLNQVQKLPPPPPEIALRFERSGLLLEFAP